MQHIGLLSCFIFLTSFLFSQNEFIVNESYQKIGGGNNNSFSVVIFETNPKNVEKAWKTLMKDFGAKVSLKKEIFAADAIIKNISSDTLNVYAIIESVNDNDSKLTVAFDMRGTFLSSVVSEVGYKTAKKLLYDFAVSCAKSEVLLQIKDAEKSLSKLKNDSTQLVKEHEDLNKKISQWELSIETAKQTKIDNEKNQELKKTEIEDQKKTIESLILKEKEIK
ncbi:MAG: hypothetical protein ABIJ97_16245 [Bacteroidota bacterium]